MRVLVAGLGAIGQRHARNLRDLVPGVELLAFRRRRLRHVVTEQLTADPARDVEAELGIEVFDDLAAALATRPEVAFVTGPTSEHLAVAQAAAEAGCDLFIEKPLSHRGDGVEALVEVVAARKLVAMVGCQWRFHPGVARLKELLHNRALGDLRSASIDYAEYLPDWHPFEDYRRSYAARAELGGGVVLTQIHDYDLAWWLFGAPVAVRARGGHLSDLEIDVEDEVRAELETPMCLVTVSQCFADRSPRRTITVEGALATVVLDLRGGTLSVRPRVAEELEFGDYPRGTMFRDELEHFLECVRDRSTPRVPLSDGVAVLDVALAVKRSLPDGRRVVVGEERR
jgi:predicted dehydrogenase